MSLAASLKLARQEGRKVAQERHAYKVKVHELERLHEGKPASTRLILEEVRDLPTQARDTHLQLKEEHLKQLEMERGRNDSLQDKVAELSGQVAKVEDLLRISRSKERSAVAEVNTLETQRRWVAVYLRTLRSKMPGFQARVAADVEAGFTEFCRLLATSLSSLAATRRRGIGVAMDDSMGPLREILDALDVKLSGPSCDVGSSSKGK